MFLNLSLLHLLWESLSGCHLLSPSPWSKTLPPMIARLVLGCQVHNRLMHKFSQWTLSSEIEKENINLYSFILASTYVTTSSTTGLDDTHFLHSNLLLLSKRSYLLYKTYRDTRAHVRCNSIILEDSWCFCSASRSNIEAFLEKNHGLKHNYQEDEGGSHLLYLPGNDDWAHEHWLWAQLLPLVHSGHRGKPVL